LETRFSIPVSKPGAENIAMWSPNPLRQVLCGWVKILRVNSKFSGRFSKGFAVSFYRLKYKSICPFKLFFLQLWATVMIS
jgi:hypothetical protein